MLGLVLQLCTDFQENGLLHPSSAATAGHPGLQYYPTTWCWTVRPRSITQSNAADQGICQGVPAQVFSLRPLEVAVWNHVGDGDLQISLSCINASNLNLLGLH